MRFVSVHKQTLSKEHKRLAVLTAVRVKFPTDTWQNTYLLTYLLTPWSRVLLEKPNGLLLLNKFPSIYGILRFITALKGARHLSLSWGTSTQSIPSHPTSWRSILILSSHLSLGLPSGLFPSDLPAKTLYTPLLSLIRATCPVHLILLDFITRTILGEEYRSFSSSLCSVPFPCHLVPLSPKYSPQHPILKHPQSAFLPQCLQKICENFLGILRLRKISKLLQHQ